MLMKGAVSVRPYTWHTVPIRVRFSRRSMVAAAEAPRRITLHLGATACGSLQGHSRCQLRTVGAAQQMSHAFAPHLLVRRPTRQPHARHTCVAPAAVTVHTKVQAVWHGTSAASTSTDAGVIVQCDSVPTEFIHALRCVIMTPLGREGGTAGIIDRRGRFRLNDNPETQRIITAFNQ